jgi:hypothetical protein
MSIGGLDGGLRIAINNPRCNQQSALQSTIRNAINNPQWRESAVRNQQSAII